MQTSKPEELYDELARRIHAEDGPGTQQVYRQLVNAGCLRQEILSQISRLIEKRGLDKASTTSERAKMSINLKCHGLSP